MDPETVIATGNARWISRCLLAVVLIAILLRVWQIAEPLWIDELHTSWVVSGAFEDVAPRARMGNQGPFYFWCVWLATQVCGHSEAALRLSSMVAGALAVWLAARVVIRHGGSLESGCIASALIAVDTAAIFYAQEARPYAWVQCLSLLQFDAWSDGFGWHADKRKSAAGRWVSVSVLLFYIHYTTLLVTAIQAVLGTIAIIRSRNRGMPEKVSAIVAVLVAALACGLAWPHVREIFARREQWKAMTDPASIGDLLRMTPTIGLAVPGLFATLYRLLGSGASSTVALDARRPTSLGSPSVRPLIPESLRAPLACALMLLVPMQIVWLLARWEVVNLCHVRYVSSSIIASACTAAWGVDLFASRSVRWSCGAGLVLASIAMSGMLAQWQSDGRIVADRNENWPALLAEISRREAGEPHPVFLCANLVEDFRLRSQPSEQFVEYLRFPLLGIYRLPGVRREIYPLPTHGARRLDVLPAWRASQPDAASLGDGKRSGRRVNPVQPDDRVWVIVRTHQSRLAREILEEFTDRFPTDDARYDRFGDLWLLEIPTGSPAPARSSAE
ncbi:MAG: hypothetical protein RIS70_3873 [Planctomycetota bacterium]